MTSKISDILYSEFIKGGNNHATKFLKKEVDIFIKRVLLERKKIAKRLIKKSKIETNPQPLNIKTVLSKKEMEVFISKFGYEGTHKSSNSLAKILKVSNRYISCIQKNALRKTRWAIERWEIREQRNGWTYTPEEKKEILEEEIMEYIKNK